MRVLIERENDGFKQSTEIEDDITDIDEDDGLLRIYINVGEGATSFASVELSKDEIVQIFQKYSEVKDRVMSDQDLGGEEPPQQPSYPQTPEQPSQPQGFQGPQTF